MWDQMGLDNAAQRSTRPQSAGSFEQGATRPSRASMTVVGGPGAGMVVAVGSKPLLIGRDLAADLVLPERTVSPRHARVVRDDGGDYWIQDLISTHGTFVGRRRISRAVLGPDQVVRLGAVVHLRFKIDDPQEAAARRAAYESTVRDPVTGAYNHAYLVERLAGEISHAISKGTSAALLLIDVDGLGELYRRDGQLGGDQTLRAVANRIAAVIDAEDVVARMEHDTLAVLAPGADSVGALKLARRIRGAVALHRCGPPAKPLSVTVCVGAAALDELGVASSPVVDLTAVAQARVDAAKRSGPNRVAARS